MQLRFKQLPLSHGQSNACEHVKIAMFWEKDRLQEDSRFGSIEFGVDEEDDVDIVEVGTDSDDEQDDENTPEMDQRYQDLTRTDAMNDIE